MKIASYASRSINERTVLEHELDMRKSAKCRSMLKHSLDINQTNRWRGSSFSAGNENNILVCGEIRFIIPSPTTGVGVIPNSINFMTQFRSHE